MEVNVEISNLSWPTLYRKTKSGSIQEWAVGIRKAPDLAEAYEIVTVYGVQGGKMQVAKELITEGKNLGRSNATTVMQQAASEATAKWELQKKKKGYVETVEAADAGEVDASVKGGIFPMLAQRFEKRADQVTYPAFVQPKFDGHRCIAIVKDGKCTLWSRTRKQITSLPHVEREVEKLTGGHDAVLDGELYNHEYHKDFEKITSLIRVKEPAEGYHKVQYHVYDMPSLDKQYSERLVAIKTLFDMYDDQVNRGTIPPTSTLVRVETRQIDGEDDAILAFDEFFGKGYEGVMVRTAKGKYLSHPTTRSPDLLKIKRFDDAEFEIVDIAEGTGKMAGRAIFVCKAGNGELFHAKMKGPLEKLSEYWLNKNDYVGAQVTVQFQGFTAANKVPRFPVALRIRTDL